VLNYLFVIVLIGSILLALLSVVHFYEPILKWCLVNKGKFMLLPAFTILLGVVIWLGFDTVFSVAGEKVRASRPWKVLAEKFPGIGSEFMPSLNEGSYLLMPTSMPHAGVEQNRRVLGQLDMMVSQIPEVDMVVGKMGRTESALDPAPISMYENIINYKPEYVVDEDGHRSRFKTDNDGNFVLTSGEAVSNEDALRLGTRYSHLIPDKDGQYFLISNRPTIYGTKLCR